MVLDHLKPHIPNTAFVAPSATLCGRVEVWDFASVWSDAVVRGDVRLVRIGAYANVQVSRVKAPKRAARSSVFQDGTVITEAFGPLNDQHDGSTIIGHYVTVGHNCVLRGEKIRKRGKWDSSTDDFVSPATTIEPECLVGMGSTLAEGSYMETQSMLGAGSFLGPGQKVLTHELWAGSPAKKIRDLTEEEIASFKPMAERYHNLAMQHRDVYEQTPVNMDAVWEAERLGLGKIIGYELWISPPPSAEKQ